MQYDFANSIRQGDCHLVPVTDFILPDDAIEIGRDEQNRIVLLRGEARGHAHVIEADDARLVEFADGERYLIVPAPAPLRHIDAGGQDTIEHAAITLAARVYAMPIQYSHVRKMPRQVID